MMFQCVMDSVKRDPECPGVSKHRTSEYFLPGPESDQHVTTSKNFYQDFLAMFIGIDGPSRASVGFTTV